MTRFLFLTAFLWIATLGANPANAQGPMRTPVSGEAHSSLAEVDQLVLAYLKENKIPGATVAISKGGRLVLSKGYGYANANTKLAMLPTHRTLIGSVSKLLTTAAVMKLHETSGNGFTVEKKMYGSTGLFKTHEYLNAIETVTRPQHPSTASIMKTYFFNTQIKHLLSHSAGWSGSGNSAAAAKMFNVAEDDVTPKHNHLYHISTRGTVLPPGIKYVYSNRSVGVMDHVIESVSGEKYSTYVKKHVLNPIGLTQVAAIGDPVTSRDAAPHRYKHVSGSASGGTPFTAYKLQPRPGTGSAGGWRATATDLVRFMVATDQLSNHSDILKPATLNLMESRPFPTTVPNRALGWGVVVKGPGSWLTHGGLGEGASAFVGKGTPGYIAGDGTDLSHVTVAICANIRQDSGKVNLAVAIARLAGKASIPVSYDLFTAVLVRQGQRQQ